ncbi:hypothetical protein DMA15_19810 [Streptomyces sp. WAC 01529]|uniref:hypothetical protein n=1 Tax=Streptomyces sp. WAC 01529 TaxID=2203205 RepID=UPI000F6EC200|nr:hypothetical protein [Streptomyces sp. WAC 01529]AZM54531.1 hypothetical protein DMA15_19810 [Streptomyces sp. WAC 01529]
MKKSTRGALAAVIACAAAAGGSASATAAEQSEVTVPLHGVEYALGMQAPEITLGLPVPLPSGSPEGPDYVEGQLLPDHVLPRVPVNNSLPSARVKAPLSDVVGDHSVDAVEAELSASDVRATTPGAGLGLPLTAPRGELWGLPALQLPSAGLHAPRLSAQPTTALGLT